MLLKGLVLILLYALAAAVPRAIVDDMCDTSNPKMLYASSWNSSGELDGWWVEGAPNVAVSEQGLLVDAASATQGPESQASLFLNMTIPENVHVEVMAEALDAEALANNLNLFPFTNDPSGLPLWETRDTRASGNYSLYHQLDGYIVTMVNNSETAGRFRLRKDPGFNLLTQTYQGQVLLGTPYNQTFVKCGDELSFFVNGDLLLSWKDQNPWTAGYFGLRTWHTKVLWRSVKIWELQAS